MGKELTTELLDRLDKYLKGTLTAEQIQSFENELRVNENLQEELEIQKNLIQALKHDSKEWDVFDPEDTDKLQFDRVKKTIESEEVQSISNKLKEAAMQHQLSTNTIKSKRRFKRSYFLMAGITLLILCILLLFQKWQAEEDFYQQYADWNTELPSFSEKSSEIDVLYASEEAFKKEKFDKVLENLSTIDPSDTHYPFALMYTGAAFHKLGQNEKAIQAFQRFNALSDLPEHSKGLWFELLIHMKGQDKDKMKVVLNRILESKDNYKYAEAKKILQKLNE